MALLDSLPGWEWVLFGFLFTVFFIVGIIAAVMIVSRYRWPLTVTILEDTDGSGHMKVSRRDRARSIAFGDSGEEIFLLKKINKFRVGYGKRIGNKAIAWAVSPTDGYWYNVSFGNVDGRLLEMGLNPVDRNIRLATASARKGIENRYDHRGWMDKYGSMVYFGLFFLTMLIFGGVIWYVFEQVKDVIPALADLAKSLKEVAEANRATAIALESIKGGSGLVG